MRLCLIGISCTPCLRSKKMAKSAKKTKSTKMYRLSVHLDICGWIFPAESKREAKTHSLGLLVQEIIRRGLDGSSITLERYKEGKTK
jgi:hypothetical protein